MELPLSCRLTLEQMIEESGCTAAALRDATAKMTVSYKEASGQGSRLVTRQCEVLAYAATRMPATFGAITASLTAAMQTLSEEDIASLSTVLDLGAGTGAAVLAVSELLPGDIRITAVEREAEMLTVGSRLTEGCPVTWEQADASSYVRRLAQEGRTFDVVVASYMTNEMTEDVRRTLLEHLWRITGKLLLLVEPGTKVGSAILRAAKIQLTAAGAVVCAPCPQIAGCPLDADDWCHFTCRVARSKLHKTLKDGDVPFEDEKFSYLALTTLPCAPVGCRILRHPQKDAGRITLTVCTPAGREIRVVTKRDRELFTAARKVGAGDSLPKG